MGNRKHLKILHLLSQRPDSTGSGIYLQAMLRGAARYGHDNFVVAGIQSDQDTEFDFIDQNQILFVKFGRADISYPIVGMSDVMPYKSRRFRDLSSDEILEYENAFSKKLNTAVTTFKPDLIHTHHLWLLSSLARQLFPEIPMVATCHGSDLRQFQNCPQFQKRVLNGCRRLDAVMALSEVQKKEIVSLYNMKPDKVFVVGAGYDDGLFRSNAKPDPDPVQIVYAGKLSRAKGVPWFLRALSKIDSPTWQLHLVGGGNGEEKDYCLRLAKKLGNRVIIHGAVSQIRLAEILGQAHIFVLPSFYEGLPLVVLEALACGCRIVATNLPGVREILGEVDIDFIDLVKTPRLHLLDQPIADDERAFEQNLTSALQQQILAAVQQPQIDLSFIRGKIDSFSWKRIFEKVQNVYAEVIS